jgi:hypothetical protein
MHINYPHTLDEISSKISQLEGKIAWMDSILFQSRLGDITISFMSYSKIDINTFHHLEQEIFAFNLELELTKLLLDNKEQLIEQLEEYKILWRTTAKKTF